MAQQPISDAVQRQILAMLKEGLAQRAIARKLKISPTTVANHTPDEHRAAPPEPKPKLGRTDDLGKDHWTISLPQTRISTLEELLEHCKVDTSLWEVERFVCNKWEMGYKNKDQEAKSIPLYQVKAWLKKRHDVARAKAIIAELRAEAAKYSPKFPPAILRMRSRYATGIWVEHSVVDHHFGAQIWGRETGRDSYDLDIARTCWRQAIATLCDRTDSYKPEGILFPIGNDQQNADNRQGNTEKGTPQSMDARYQKVHRVSRGETVWAVDQFLARYGRVHIVPVPGNHDPLATFHLGEYLEAWYRRDPRVTVDTRPLFRKYWELGVVGIGFLHGNTGKMEDYGKTFAAEQSELWGRTKWREMHSADKHHRREIEFDGYTVRILPSLRPVCAWSAENMYGAIRASESHVWSKTEGRIGGATFSILPGNSKTEAA